MKSSKVASIILIVTMMFGLMSGISIPVYGEDGGNTTLTINVDVIDKMFVGLASIVNEDMVDNWENSGFTSNINQNSDGKTFDVSITGPFNSDKPYYIYIYAKKYLGDQTSVNVLLMATYNNDILDNDTFVLDGNNGGIFTRSEILNYNIPGYRGFPEDGGAGTDNSCEPRIDGYFSKSLWLYRKIQNKYYFICDVKGMCGDGMGSDKIYRFIPELPEGESYYYQFNYYNTNCPRFTLFFDNDNIPESRTNFPKITFKPDKPQGKIINFRPERKDYIKYDWTRCEPLDTQWGYFAYTHNWSCTWENEFATPYVANINPGDYDRFVFLVKPNATAEAQEVVIETVQINEEGISSPNAQTSGSSITVPIPDVPPTPIILYGVQLDEELYRLNVGENLQVRLTASYSDGSDANVTKEATYTSYSPAIASIDSNGTITANSPGKTSIIALFNSKSCETMVEVIDVPRLTATPNQPLIEENLNDNELTLTLSGEIFRDNELDKNYFTLNNAPIGVKIGAVEYISDTEAKLTLIYDETDFDTDIHDFSVTINGVELDNEDESALTSNELDINAIRDVIQFEPALYSYKEDEGTVPVNVVYTKEDNDVTVTTDYLIEYEQSRIDVTTGYLIDYAVTGGSARHESDFNGQLTGTLAFGKEVTSQSINIEIIDDSIFNEENETILFKLNMENLTEEVELGINTATLTIRDNDIKSSGGGSIIEKPPTGSLINRMPGHKSISKGKKINKYKKEIILDYKEDFFEENLRFTPRIYHWNKDAKKWVALATYIDKDGKARAINAGNYKGWFCVFAVLQPEFVDVENHWGEETANRMNGLAMVEGYEIEENENQRELKPEQDITIAEFSTLIYRLLNIDLDNTTFKELEDNKIESILSTGFADYNDIPNWAKQQLAILTKAEILSGREGNCEANESITRIEAALMVSKALKILDKFKPADFSKFKDADDIPVWAKAAISEDVLTGYPDGTLKPNNFIKRIEALTVLERLFVNGMGW